MLRLALLFFFLALASALFGYGALGPLWFEGARVLFFLFLALSIAFFVGNYVRGCLHGAPPA